MDNKQQNIYKHILDNNNLSHNNTFVQFRNLKEFRSFFIERINPTHRILLFGKLKKPKDKNYNRVVKVGEILLCMGSFLVIPSFILNICINIIVGVILFNIYLGLINNAYRDRRKCWNRKNVIHGSLLG
jgi:hypothetical protein